MKIEGKGFPFRNEGERTLTVKAVSPQLFQNYLSNIQIVFGMY